MGGEEPLQISEKMLRLLEQNQEVATMQASVPTEGRVFNPDGLYAELEMLSRQVAVISRAIISLEVQITTGEVNLSLFDGD